jgi:hypothetical protein
MTIAIDARRRPAPSHIASSSGLGRLLDEFESLLLVVPSSAYEAVPERGGATIARHVGQCLDLIDTILSVGSGRVIVYPHRQGTAGMDRTTSVRRIHGLRKSLINWPGRSLDGIVSVDHVLWPPDDVERGWPTLDNEFRSSWMTSLTAKRSSNAW